jgi:hypothetical protein
MQISKYTRSPAVCLAFLQLKKVSCSFRDIPDSALKPEEASERVGVLPGQGPRGGRGTSGSYSSAIYLCVPSNYPTHLHRSVVPPRSDVVSDNGSYSYTPTGSIIHEAGDSTRAAGA